MSEYKVAHLEDIDEMSDGRAPWRPVRHHLGITSFGINTWTGREAGERIINEHEEEEGDEGDEGDEELYFVHSGRARFEIDGDSVDARAGTFVFVPPGLKRTAFAEEPGTTVVAMGATPGQVYEPVGWEIWMPINRWYQAGEYEEAANRGREIAEANPQYVIPLYNLACCESLAGRKEDAIEHLRLAIERSDRVRKYAATDSDFDAIRDDPRFKELVS